MNPDTKKIDNTTITSDKLKAIDPLILPKAKPQVAAQGAIDYMGKVNEANKQQSAQEKLQADQLAEKTSANLAKEKSWQDIIGIQKEFADVESTIDRTAENEARKLNDEYTSQIEAEQTATRRAIESLEKNNPQGLYGGALEDQVNRIRRESLSKQADLGILQNASSRRYETARSIADKAKEAKLEPLRMKYDNAKMFYTDNKANFSKADDRVYSEMVKKADTELKRETDYQTKIAELKGNVAQFAGKNAGSVLNQLSRIDSKDPKAYDKALALAGQYQSDPLDRRIKQAQLAKINTDISKTRSDMSAARTTAVSTEATKWADAIRRGDAKLSDVPKALKASVVTGLNTSSSVNKIDEKILSSDQFKKAQAAKNLNDTLKKAITAVNTYGNNEVLNATGKGILDSLQTQLRSEISIALEQGVVVPGEAENFDKIAGQLQSGVFTRNNKTKASLKSLSDSMNQRINTQKSAIKAAYGIDDNLFNNALGLSGQVSPTVDATADYYETTQAPLLEVSSPFLK